MRSRIYHYKLSGDDKKPKCALCDQQSMFYCNMNDLYYCKYATSLGMPESEAQEIVAESFLYLQMQSSPDEDPLQKGDTFGVGFS